MSAPLSRSLRIFGALCSKELAHYFYSPAAYLVSAGFLLVSGYLFSVPLFLLNQASVRGFIEGAPLLMTFVVPAITMRLFAEEFKSGTAELLLTMPVTDWQVLLAKTAGAFCVVCAMLCPTVVYPVTVAFLGNLDGGAVLCSYAGLALLGLMLCCVGVFASSCARNQVAAFITGFLFCFAFFMAGKVVPFLPGILGRAADFVGFDTHLDAFARGVADTRDIIYFLSVSALFLYFALLRLWRRPAQ